ncbi:hypothetical protein A2630_00585 [Candidatus Woesebacteria bacterium RIFCSPHIGHO2_01_FULL_44_10]|uniref:Aminoglycoside phosphotransferase domain-containing protein n=1 Tax=Candidatus Woesebacteria bacterium RIFCSPLOWO2_01_FULL_44_14 TaxID=1802525 RepID=A0A1F8C1N7_9BACT|nr:MAG: hypothetical protein A2630_00585 [Candidatus Woesebacteria bacterium RIFCSPHIGHO2_01_FULL_44_10]OGM54378.1 MAG: hypothetical protein A3F62_01340 [Candidatus Woesebacteria bacterium RIFCSPHIGHO2_12_FULL_44_11]OGM70281.1 MAG: hypothetical protein A2975_04390 [Candidatus Woesebacteria bacterium RIFCSPLOWO2_01_FULL_44_14]
MDKDRDKLTNHDQQARSEITLIMKSGWSDIDIVDIEDHTEQGYFGGVYCIKSTERSYALKKHPRSFKGKFDFHNQVSNFISNTGDVRYFPSTIPTESRELAVDEPETDSFWVLNEWVEGRDMRYRSRQENVDHHLPLIFRKVAQMHSQLASFPIGDDSVVDRSLSEHWVPEMLERFDLVSKGDSTRRIIDLTGIDSASLTRFMSMSDRFIEDMLQHDKPKYWDHNLTRTVIHGDLNLSHVFEASGDYVLVDIDRMKYGMRLDDLGNLISEAFLSCGQNTVLESLRTAEQVLPLTDVEKEDLTQYVKYGKIRQNFWLLNEILTRNDPMTSFPLQLEQEVANTVLLVENLEINDRT